MSNALTLEDHRNTTGGSQTPTLTCDAENRLVQVSGPGLSAQFTYDGDGRRVLSTVNGVTTAFVGNHYEATGGSITKYYFAGASRVAMRQDGTLYFLLSDHLGSTSLTLDANGNKLAGLRYTAWGAVRHADGVTPTPYTFTGQYSHMAQFGLMFFNARWLDPALGRFVQADTVIPEVTQGMQAWDRYAGMNNNPVRYNDPTGHTVACANDAGLGCEGFGPASIIDTYNYSEEGDVYLRKFLETHPNYNPELDPLVTKNPDFDAGVTLFWLRTLQFQVAAMNVKSWEQSLYDELQQPEYANILGWEYTPVISSAISVLGTDIAFSAPKMPLPPHAKVGVFGAGYLVGRAASIVNLASTGYQYNHNLYGTTKVDFEIAAAATIMGAPPKPEIASTATHLSFLYSLLRLGGMPSP